MKIMKNNAQLLITVLFLLLMVGTLAGALAALWPAEIRMRVEERQGLIAFYLAQAGIERAKIEVINDVTLFGTSAWLNDLDLAGDSYTFRYNFNVVIMGPQRRLIGRGEVLDLNNNLLAQREIEVRINGIVDVNPPGGDGIDDDGLASLVSWSWQEI